MNKKWYGVIGSIIAVAVVFGVIWFENDRSESTESVQETSSIDEKEGNEREKAYFDNLEGEIVLIRDEKEISITEENDAVYIQPGDILKSGENAKATLVFHDETAVHMGSNAQLTIEKWEKEQSHHVIVIQHEKGQLFHEVKTGDRYSVVRKNDVVNVKGTLFHTIIDPVTGKTTLTVLDGVVSVDRPSEDRDDDFSVWLDNLSSFVTYIDDPNLTPTVEMLDVTRFLQNLDMQLFEAMIIASAKARDKYDQRLQESRHDIDEDLERKANELHAFIANLLRGAIDLGLIDPKKVQELLNEINEQNPERTIELDQIPEFNPDENRLDGLLEELERRNQERAQEESHVNDEIERRLAERRTGQESARQRVQEEMQRIEGRQRIEGSQQRLEEQRRRAEEQRQDEQKQEQNKRIEVVQISNQFIQQARISHLNLQVQPHDAKIQAKTNHDDVIKVDTEGNQLILEALREGTALVEVIAEKDGFTKAEMSFQVEVTPAHSLPIGKWVFIPNNHLLTFDNGVQIDLRQQKINDESRILVEDVNPILPPLVKMEKRGTVVNVSFEEVNIIEPVNITLPIDKDADLENTGIFYQKLTGDWEYQPTKLVDGGLQAIVSDFSTFGVFSAEKMPTPTAITEPGEVPINTEIQLVSLIDGADIYYTTNGDEPTKESTRYEEPISIKEDTTVKAIAFGDNRLISEVASFEYTIQRKHAVSFTVTDGENAIPNATVTLGDLEETTDTEGKVQFSVIDGEYDYVVTAAGYEENSGVVNVDGADVEQEISLERQRHAVSFTVTDGENVIPNATVTLGDLEETTDTEGNVQFSVIDGEYDYVVTATGYEENSGVVNVDGADVEQAITLERERHAVTFTVTDGENVIPNASVTLGDHEETTDTEGNVQFSVIDGEYDYVVTAAEYEENSGVVNVAGADVEQAITLERERHAVTFTVTDGENVIPNASVTLGDHEETTDTEGNVQFSVIDGEYVYVVTADGYVESTGEVEVAGSDVEQEITLERERHAVTFTVTDGENAIPNATVTLGDLEATTDTEGNVQFSVIDGEYDYVVTAAGYEENSGVVNVDGADVEQEVTLQQLLGTVSGHVIEVCPAFECGELRPDPVLEAHVTVLAGDDVIGEAWTDEEGYYEIQDVPANTDLVVKTVFYSGWVPDGHAELISEVLQVQPEENLVVDFEHKPFDVKEIRTPEELDAVRENLNGNYVLMNDIDLSSYENWEPIGDERNHFTGMFDGNDYTITNLSIDSKSSSVGLFGYFNGDVIENVHLENVEVHGERNVGGLVGLFRGNGTIGNVSVEGTITGKDNIGGIVGWNQNDGFIWNANSSVSVTGTDNSIGGLVGQNYGMIAQSNATGDVRGNNSVGGLVGYHDGGTIRDSKAKGKVEGNAFVGGFIGYSGGESSSVVNVQATGDVIGEQSEIGGLIGYLHSGNLRDAYASGDVTGEGRSVGGFVGQNSGTIEYATASGNVTSRENDVGGFVGFQNGSIEYAYATGNVTGADNVGGFVGTNRSAIQNTYATGNVTGNLRVGGHVGSNSSGTIQSSYSVGMVTANLLNSGGFAGCCGTVNNSYYDTVTSGRDDVDKGGIPKTTAEMKQQATYVDWNFDETWVIREGETYPHLRYFNDLEVENEEKVVRDFQSLLNRDDLIFRTILYSRG